MAGQAKRTLQQKLNAAEYSAYKQLLKESRLKAVLNEKPPAKTELVELPEAVEGCIVPEDLFQSRKHPDVRIERRASTIASLAKVVSERKVSKGLRATLCTQARRLLSLAERRYQGLAALPDEDDGGNQIG